MIVAVNTRFLTQGNLEGIGTYTFEILKRIVKEHPEDDFHFIFDRPYLEEFIFAKNITPIVVGPQARHGVLWKIWFEIKLPKVIKKINADVFLSLDGYTSIRAKCRKIMVVHDLAFEHYPKFIPGWAARYYKKYTPKFINAVDKVVAVSEFTKNDIISYYKTDKDKISVIGNAAASNMEVLEDFPKEIEDFIDNGKYFLYLGALHPRKNIMGVLKAYEKFREKNFRKVKLVIAGRDAWANDGLKSYAAGMSFKSEVLFVGEVTELVKNKLYLESEGFLYCSFFEGFGIPILEAQTAGCPVITSDNSSMPEVGGEGALYCMPSKVGTIVEQMSRLVNEPGLKQSLISKGYENAKRYSWDDSAKKMYKLIEEVVQA